MSDNELKPCMRCGSVNIHTPQSGSDDDIIVCLDCGYSARWQNGQCNYANSARGVWNNQPYADALRAKLAAAQAREAKYRGVLETLTDSLHGEEWTLAHNALAEKS